MNVVEFTEYLVKSIVKEKDLVKVSEFEADEDIKILEILVPESCMGQVIGKNGKMSMALKTVIQAFALVNNLPKVKINIDSF